MPTDETREEPNELSPDAMATRLSALKRIAEEAYDAMYDGSLSSGAAGPYSDAKEALYQAIFLAKRMPGAEDEVRALEARLAHIKAVFRSQFA